MPLGRVNVHPKDQRRENGRNPQQREAHTRGRKYAIRLTDHQQEPGEHCLTTGGGHFLIYKTGKKRVQNKEPNARARGKRASERRSDRRGREKYTPERAREALSAYHAELCIFSGFLYRIGGRLCRKYPKNGWQVKSGEHGIPDTTDSVRKCDFNYS